ncbi:MAG: hypothetical protein DRH08_00445 [Deltaproteobacteria bacterium]|nr:MAG: hypothetical protein DRH08_00445 [Deltaproteobacteria bacterium]
MASTAKGNIIVGMVSHDKNVHESQTLLGILRHIEVTQGTTVKTEICDRGYRGKSRVNNT